MVPQNSGTVSEKFDDSGAGRGRPAGRVTSMHELTELPTDHRARPAGRVTSMHELTELPPDQRARPLDPTSP